MAEQDSSQEKTEEPTPRRLQKARDEGQVPRSKELGTTMVLVMGAGDVNSLWSRLSANSAQGQASCQSAVAS